jgi:hypothetical protein
VYPSTAKTFVLRLQVFCLAIPSFTDSGSRRFVPRFDSVSKSRMRLDMVASAKPSFCSQKPYSMILPLEICRAIDSFGHRIGSLIPVGWHT